MGEFIDPAIVPKMKVYTGEEIPGIGMGTFGSDRVSPEEVSARKKCRMQWREQSAAVTECLTVQHAMETKIRSERYLKMPSTKALWREKICIS